MVLHFYTALREVGKEVGYGQGICAILTEIRLGKILFLLKSNYFHLVSSLVSLESTGVTEREKAHSLRYQCSDTHFCSLSIVFEVFSQSHYPKFWKLNAVQQTVSPYRHDTSNAETTLRRQQRKHYWFSPGFSYLETVDFMVIIWKHPVKVSLPLPVEKISVSSNIRPLPQTLLISKQQLENRTMGKC